MRDRILAAATAQLVQNGLNNWTVEEVARRAECAKGLVNYHYRSKQALLERVASTLRDQRWNERGKALTGGNPLDRLWQTLIKDVQSGRFSAWLGLLAAGGTLRQAATPTSDQTTQFAMQVGNSLGLGDDLVPHVELIAGALDGLELRLLEATGVTPIEEAYHRFWLTVL